MPKKKNGNNKALVTFDMLTEFYHELIKPQFDRINEKMDKGFGELQQAVNKNSEDIQVIKTELRYIKNDIDGIKADISTSPTRKEFNELKSEVRSISS